MKKTLVVALSALMVATAPVADAATKRNAEVKHKTTAKSHAKKTVAHTKSKRHAVVAKKTASHKSRHVSHVAHASPAAPAVAKPVAYEPASLKLSRSLQAVPVQASYDVASAEPGPELLSNAVLVVDQATGKPLFAKNSDMQTPIASITKLMTSVVVLDAQQSLNDKITITDDDIDRLKNTHSRLAVGTTLTRGELLHLALIASENRAASALARNYPGGTAACIRAMNRKATSLGMSNTHYVDGTGLNSSNQSTAADLAKLVNVASSQYPLIREITSTGAYGVELTGYRMVRMREHGKVRRVAKAVERRVAFNNTNVLTRDPDWDIGLSKTGFINEAGHCLVMQAKIGERKVIMVLLDSVGKMSRIGDANRVRRWLEGETS